MIKYLATEEKQQATNDAISQMDGRIDNHLGSIDRSIETISQKMNAVNVTQVAVFVADFVSSPVNITHGYLHSDGRYISTQ